MSGTTTVMANGELNVMLVFDEDPASFQMDHPFVHPYDRYYVVYHGRTTSYRDAVEGHGVEDLALSLRQREWLRDAHMRMCAWVNRRPVRPSR